MSHQIKGEMATRLPWVVSAGTVPAEGMANAPKRPAMERRHPERHRHTMWLLRRVALICLVAAVGLLVVPRVLAWLGVIGPKAPEVVEGAAQALEVARTYGARPADPPFASATRELEAARRLLAEGRALEARRAAERAYAHAIEAQRVAVARSQTDRRRAEEILEDLDRRVEELEDLYDEVKPGVPKEEGSALLSLMKNARETAAQLSLATQEGDYERVLKEERAALGVLEAVRERLLTARRP